MSEVEVKQSAYKHGCTYDDIINCYRFPIKSMILAREDASICISGWTQKAD